MSGLLLGLSVGVIMAAVVGFIARIFDFFAEQRAREQVRREHPELFRGLR